MNRTAAHTISGWRRLLHWVSALLVIAMLAIGLNMTGADLSDPAAVKDAIWRYSLHKTIGLLVLLITLVRLISMAVSRGFVHSAHKRYEVIAATAVQAYFLIALVALPVTGLTMHVFASGSAPIWILPEHWIPFTLTPNDALVQTTASVHEFLAKGVLIGIVLHFGGAAKHWIFDADGTIARMVTGFSTKAGNDGRGATADDVHTGHLLGTLIAIAVAIAGASSHLYFTTSGGSQAASPSATGTANAAKANTQSSTPANVSTSVLAESLLTISAVQGGDPFTASFDRFDVEMTGSAPPESLVVNIVGDSFSSGLGDRDDVVKSADWLDTLTFPEARYETSAISETETGEYSAEGTLTIRGISTSVPLNFTLVPDGQGLRLEGTASFNRFDVELGRGEFGSESAAASTIDVQFDVFLKTQ